MGQIYSDSIPHSFLICPFLHVPSKMLLPSISLIWICSVKTSLINWISTSLWFPFSLNICLFFFFWVYVLLPSLSYQYPHDENALHSWLTIMGTTRVMGLSLASFLYFSLSVENKIHVWCYSKIFKISVIYIINTEYISELFTKLVAENREAIPFIWH